MIFSSSASQNRFIGSFALYPVPSSNNGCRFYHDIPFSAMVPAGNDSVLLNYIDQQGNSKIGRFNLSGKKVSTMEVVGAESDSSVFVSSVLASKVSVIQITGVVSDDECLFNGIGFNTFPC